MAGTALVTGASSGIGRAVAVAMAKAGWKTAICARREDGLKETAAMAAGMLPIVCDVSDPDSVKAMFAKIEKDFGRLDTIFNNAGTNIPATNFGDLEWSAWKKVIDVNLNGMFLCAHGAFNLMRKQQPQGGRIINNGSISAHVPRPGSAPYTASKHAVTGLTRSISLTERMAKGVPQADGTMKPEPTMDVQHVADAVVHMAGLPLEANVQFMTIMSTKMPFIGRG